MSCPKIRNTNRIETPRKKDPRGFAIKSSARTAAGTTETELNTHTLLSVITLTHLIRDKPLERKKKHFLSDAKAVTH